jgi:hypothetical protein
MANQSTARQKSKQLPVDQAATFVLDESRMILPGIQALFGFQLMVVFNDAFTEKLSVFEQRLHLLAIALILITTVIIMTQAVFHRQTGEKEVEQDFVRIATRLLLIGMIPLATSISIEFYIISRLILGQVVLPFFFALGLFGFFLLLWFGLPRLRVLQQMLARKR